MGRVGILGGSEEYTGAPYYAGKSALMLGADLSYIFCAESAMTPIKSYSPEVMVVPFYSKDDLGGNDKTCSDIGNLNRTYVSAETQTETGVEGKFSTSLTASRAAIVIEYFPRLHSLVVGPGLGRAPVVMDMTRKIIMAAIGAGLPLVIDADGLHVLAQDLNLIKGYKKCVLTPNAVEFERLRVGVLTQIDVKGKCQDDLESRDLHRQVHALSQVRYVCFPVND